MKYRLFLSDLDGTLLRTDGRISDATKRAIADYRKAGGIFVVCTGRGPASALPRIREAGITQGLFAAFQGGVVGDIETGEYLRCVSLSAAEAAEVLRYFYESGLHAHYYTPEDYYANERNSLLEMYESVYGQRATLIEEPLYEKAARESLPILKILVVIKPEDGDEALQKTEVRFGERFYVTRSSPWLIEVLPKNVNKGAAVAFFSERFSLPVESIAAAGDQLNDLPMLTAAGGKFTMENGADELKAIATVLPSNDEDGVAYAIRKYAMGEEI